VEERQVPPAPAAAPGLAATLGVKAWDEIRMAKVDGHTVRIEAGGQSLLRTFVELGFVDGRKRDVVTPISAWPLFLLFCEHGEVKPSVYGEFGVANAAKKAIERIGAALRQAFGLEKHPIHAYSKGSKIWVARFLAGAPGKASAEMRTKKRRQR